LALDDLPPDKVPEPRQQVSATKVVNNKVPILGVVNPNLSIFQMGSRTLTPSNKSYS
jgi:hypothetical protein